MMRSPLGMQLVSALALLIFGVTAASPFVSRIEAIPAQWRRIREQSAAEREQRTLEVPVRGIFEAATLVSSAFTGVGYQDIGLIVVAPGGAEPPYPAIHGQVLLQHHLAPRAKPRGWPLDLLQRSLEGDGPGRPSPQLLADLDGALIGLAVGIPGDRVDALVALATAQFGMPVLHRGKSLGDRHHVLLFGDLPERVRAGDPAYQRYRELLR